jgi:hypothetical protein
MGMLERKRDAEDCVPGLPFDQQPEPTGGKGKRRPLRTSRSSASQDDAEEENPSEAFTRDWKNALAMLKKVMESNAPEKEIAEEDLRYIRRRMQAESLDVVSEG